MAERARILVDVQERRSGMPELLAELGAEIEVMSLTAGDYVVGDDTIVERKAVLDLHGAVRRGHLWAQLGRGLHPNAIRGACLAVIDQGVPLLRSDDRADSARWLHRLATRCQREARSPGLPSLVPRATVAPRSVQEAMLAAVPGISTIIARALLERFGSVVAIATASHDRLLEVPGVGVERARAIVDAFRPVASGA